MRPFRVDLAPEYSPPFPVQFIQIPVPGLKPVPEVFRAYLTITLTRAFLSKFIIYMPGKDCRAVIEPFTHRSDNAYSMFVKILVIITVVPSAPENPLAPIGLHKKYVRMFFNQPRRRGSSRCAQDYLHPIFVQ